MQYCQEYTSLLISATGLLPHLNVDRTYRQLSCSIHGYQSSPPLYQTQVLALRALKLYNEIGLIVKNDEEVS
jgi:hypothetical protein